MDALRDLISSGGSTAGALSAIIGFVALVGGFLYRYSRKAAADEVSENGALRAEDAARLDSIERDLRDVTTGLRDVHERQDRTSERLASVERALGGVAKASDLNSLRADFREHVGRVEAQNSATRNMLDTLYQAAIQQSKGN